MKSNDKPQNMVARKETAKTPFTVVHTEAPESEAEQLSQEVADEETELSALLDGITQRQKELADKKAQAAALARQEKVEKRSALLDDAADWREMARTNADPDKAREYLRRAKEAEREAVQLATELGIGESTPMVDAPTRPSNLLSSNKALGIVGALFVLCLAITIRLAMSVMADPSNAMGQSMVMNSPLRVMLAFTLTFLTVLVGFLFLRLFFPQIYRIWHNRVETERSLDTILQEAPAGIVLAGLLGLLALFMSVFAGYYQALYV
ncbi:hypothetical protein [Rudanella lutea]|uniref:hypothetical protein n=1 Tax=Rudanella lutea TaxID=451374 RepID=UPI00037D89CA|nr:hypothetical protein [Rudanella lutea]